MFDKGKKTKSTINPRIGLPWLKDNFRTSKAFCLAFHKFE